MTRLPDLIRASAALCSTAVACAPLASSSDRRSIARPVLGQTLQVLSMLRLYVPDLPLALHADALASALRHARSRQCLCLRHVPPPPRP